MHYYPVVYHTTLLTLIIALFPLFPIFPQINNIDPYNHYPQNTSPFTIASNTPFITPPFPLYFLVTIY